MLQGTFPILIDEVPLKRTLPQLIEDYKKNLQPHFENQPWFSQTNEEQTLSRMLAFFTEHSNPFERACIPGHFTGSTWLINKAGDKVALCYHKKLKIWLQLGGHADGCEDLAEVAFKEAQEESGIDDLKFWSEDGNNKPQAFDFDIHTIPANKKDPEHLHLDVRFVIQAKNDNLVLSDESLDLRWFAFDEVQKMTQEESVLRQMKKFLALSQKN